jgi:L-alanine-DL-glutamate epimerase-like enolase superfamily enzyme
MIIDDVECLFLDGEFPFVRVRTDGGLVGWGECYRRAGAVSKATIEQLLSHGPAAGCRSDRRLSPCRPGSGVV